MNVRELSCSLEGREILHGVSFTLGEGEFLAVLGPNGAGKTTLFRCVLGNLPGCRGEIALEGKDLRSMSRAERAAAAAYIPQIHRPGFGYSVLDMVLMGATHTLGAFSAPGKKERELALESLRRVGAEGLAERDFTSLSGGERQLVLIARALAQRSRILVMDEPTSALDYGNRIRILEMVRGLADEGYGILLSTHDPQHVLSYADSVLALKGGAVVAGGSVAETLDSSLIRNLYGVETDFLSSPSGPVIIPKKGGISHE